MPTTAQRALIRRVVRDIWNEGDVDASDDLFASDYVNHGGLIPDLVSGPEAIKISVVLYRRAFPWLYVSIDELQSNGEVVTLTWTARNDRPDDLPHHGVAQAQPNHLTGKTRIRCMHGKIAESWTTWNSGALRAVLYQHLAA